MRESQSSGGTSMKEGQAEVGLCPALEQAPENKGSFAVVSPGARTISPGRFGVSVAWGESGLADQGSESEDKEGNFNPWRAKPVERSAD